MFKNKTLKRLRLEKNLTQQELGDMCGVHFSTICHIEDGTRQPSLKVFVEICKALSVSSDLLLTLN
jgi:DNA-binding XRE family transcriptional regulator